MNNISTNTTLAAYIEMPLDVMIFGSIVYVLLFSIGITGNTLTIYVLTQKKKMQNFTNYLLANLAIADTLILLSCMPTSIHDLFSKERSFNLFYLNRFFLNIILFIEINKDGFLVRLFAIRSYLLKIHLVSDPYCQYSL